MDMRGKTEPEKAWRTLLAIAYGGLTQQVERLRSLHKQGILPEEVDTEVEKMLREHLEPSLDSLRGACGAMGPGSDPGTGRTSPRRAWRDLLSSAYGGLVQQVERLRSLHERDILPAEAEAEVVRVLREHLEPSLDALRPWADP